MTRILLHVGAARLTPVCEDRPSLHATSDGGLRLELMGREGMWIIELTLAECEAIAEAIGYRPAGYSRPEADADS